jgi:putative ABC transport system permease protein
VTKDELIAREKAIWQKTTAAGYIFEMGVAVGFIIGVFIIYQILYIEISDHLPQLATLKAIGNGNGYLMWLVLAQAALLTLLAFIPAVAITSGLPGWRRFNPNELYVHRRRTPRRPQGDHA